MEGMSALLRAAAVTLCAFTVAACSSSATGEPAAPPAQDTANIVPDSGALSSLHWHGCGGGVAPECATLSVPLNHADPSGRHIQLALSMVPATAPASRQQGVLLVNPGGPGGSGLALASEVASGLSPGVAADYDIVGFDPRGVGSSVPALSCDPSFFSGVRADYIPADAAAERALLARAKMYADDCEQRFGWLLPYMTTRDVARDLDAIRQAFGVSKINYYAFSYGTYLGQVYGTMFPQHVRRMVLDSTVDPAGVWYADNIDQDYAFQGRMDAFFAWVAKNHATYHLGDTTAQVQASWYRARKQLEEHPANGMVGADEFDDTYLLGGYLNTLWPGLAQALASYLNDGQTGDLISQYQANGAQNENEFAVYNAVQCSDVSWPRSWARWDADTRAVYKTAPYQAWDNAWYNAACVYWPVTGPAEPMKIDGSGLPGILMLQGTLDAATPYAGAQDAHKQLPTAAMVVVEGGGNHGQSLEDPADGCVQRYLNAYLADGALPEATGLVDATCPAVPDPAPGD
jgi:pimeloyl-ACP methyl ester carboxylesterase